MDSLVRVTASFLLLNCNRPRSVSFRRPSPLFLPVDQQRGALRGGPHRLRLNLGRKSRPSAPSSAAAEVVQRRLRGSAQTAPAELGGSAGPPQERHPRPRSQDLGGQGGRKRQTGCACAIGSARFSLTFCSATWEGKESYTCVQEKSMARLRELV